MKYYLRLTDSDKFVNGGAYSDEFLKQINGNCAPTTDNWKVLKSYVAIELDGTNEQYIQARNLLIEICGEDYEFDKPLPNYNYLTIGSMGGILLMNKVEGFDVITLPINQIKEPFKTQLFCDACDELDDILGAHDPIYTQLYDAAKSLNLSYLDGKILESLTNKDYTKIIELCKTQLNN